MPFNVASLLSYSLDVLKTAKRNMQNYRGRTCLAWPNDVTAKPTL